jgi:hypothetical protein
VTVQPSTRERILAASALSQKIERLEAAVNELLEQPSASSANERLDLLDRLVYFVPSAAIIACFVPGPGPGLLRGLMVLAIGVPLTVALGYSVRAKIAERHALRELTVGMSARNPPRAGEPPRCRQCGGTLLIRRQHVVALCLFCNAENLLGLDVRPFDGPSSSRLYQLQSIVSARALQRRRAKVGAAICCVLALIVALVFAT